MRTVLMISRYFPPLFDVGGKRAYRFARYLPEHGWRPVVWTSPIPPNKRTDPTPLDLPDAAQVIRGYTAPSARPRAGARMSDGTAAAPLGAAASTPSLTARAWDEVKRWTRPPVDGDLSWAPAAARALAQVAKEVEADVIWTTSSPYSALVFGAATRALTGLPLVLDLRDPWTLNFLHARRSPWVQRVDGLVERALFGYAQRVVLTCASASDAYRAHLPHLPDDRIVTITNSFDPVQRPAAPPASTLDPAAPVTVVHFGNCYGPRRLAPVLRALALLRTRDPDAAAAVRLLNLGRVAADDLALAETLQLSDALTHRPVVPYEEGLAILASADLQLLLAYGDETLFLPAKLYDYLLTQAPILGVARPSELTDILDRTGAGVWAQPDDLNRLADLLQHAVESRRGGPNAAPITDPNPEHVDRFASPSTTAELAALLDDVCAR